MNSAVLVPIGAVPDALLGAVVHELVHALGWQCDVSRLEIDPQIGFHVERQQHHSTELLRHLLARTSGEARPVIGLTPVDLYIPILKYVFGEAELGGRGAVVGYRRLREEFYGLPDDPAALARRVGCEVIHELGHVVGLHHCENYSCVMASAHSVERIDLKSNRFCGHCLPRFRSATEVS
ncbi:MAG: archaemetzincin family Zn-dependent metalloprotease [Thermoanaerobaculia bacterium]